MRSRILNVVEASAIQQDHQDAMKRIIKSLSYDAQTDIHEAIVDIAEHRS
jgi:hypothetical protein